MAASVVQGKNVVLKAYNTDNYYGFYCAQTVAITFETDQLPSTSIESGDIDEYVPGATRYNVSLAGVLFLKDSSDKNWTAGDLTDQAMRRGGVPMQLIFTNENGSTESFSFKGNIASNNITGTAGQIGKFAVKFQGSGPWVRSNTFGVIRPWSQEFSSAFGG